MGALENDLTYNIEQFLRKVKDVDEEDSDEDGQERRRKKKRVKVREENVDKPQFGDDFDSDRE